MTTTLTVNGLYAADANVRAMIDTWVEHRRCPAPLGDYLEETYDLLAAADCARWAATQRERHTYDDRSVKSFPYPRKMTYQDFWYWMGQSLVVPQRYSHNVPGAIDQRASGVPDSPTALGAIIWLLDNWIMGCAT